MNTDELLRILACPRCLGDLNAIVEGETLTGFACEKCCMVYPVRDDIPVMLIEESISRTEWDAGKRSVG